MTRKEERERQRRWMACMHEAGHAVACCHYDFKFKNLRVEMTETSEGGLTPQVPFFKGTKFAESLLDEYVITLLAGPEAERRVNQGRRDLFGAEDDYLQAARMIESCCFGEESIRARMRWQATDAKLLVDLYEPSICAVANVLFRAKPGKVLGQAKVKAIMEEAVNTEYKRRKVLHAKHGSRAEQIQRLTA